MAREIKIPITGDLRQIIGQIGSLKQEFSKLKLGDNIGNQFERSMKIIDNQVESLQKRINKGFFTKESDITGFSKEINQIVKQLEGIAALQGKVSLSNIVFSDADKSRLSELNKQIEETKKQISGFKSTQVAKLFETDEDFSRTMQETLNISRESFQSEQQVASAIKGKLKDLEKEVELRQQSLEKNVELERSFEAMQALVPAPDGKGVGVPTYGALQIMPLVEDFSKIFADAGYKTAFTAGQTTFQQIQEEFNKAMGGIDTKQQVAELDKLQEAFVQLQEAQQKLSASQTFAEKEKLQTQYAELTNSANEFKQSILESTKQNFSQLVSGLDKTESELKDIAVEADDVKNSLGGISETDAVFNRLATRAAQFFTVGTALKFIAKEVKQAIQEIKELDVVITNIAVVTDMTVDQVWQTVGAYSAVAKQYGASLKGVYETSQLWYQTGMSQNQVMAATTETLKLARIASIDYATATDYMLVAMRGFSIEATNLNRIVDVYSKLAAVTASDTQEIAVAMSKTAAIAHSAGMELESTSAMLAMIIDQTREAPESIGSSLNTIISRFQKLSESPLELIDVEGEISSMNDIDEALQAIGITLQDKVTGQFRDLDDVIFELADVWDGLDRNYQAYLANLIAGTRQQSRFLALMSDNERLTELYSEALNSADAGLLQFSKTMDSMEYKLNNIKTTWQEFYMQVLNGPVLSTAVGWLQKILDLITGMHPALVAVAGISLTPLFGKLASSIIGSFTGTKVMTQAMNGLTSQIAAGFGKAATTGAATFGKSFLSGLSGIGLGIGIAAILIGAIDYASKASERRVAKLAENVQSTDIARAQSKDELQILKDYQKEYEKLSKTQYYDEESRQKFLDLNSEIVDKYPELLSSMDSEGNYLVDLGNGYEKLAKEKEEDYQASLKAYRLAQLQQKISPEVQMSELRQQKKLEEVAYLNPFADQEDKRLTDIYKRAEHYRSEGLLGEDFSEALVEGLRLDRLAYGIQSALGTILKEDRSITNLQELIEAASQPDSGVSKNILQSLKELDLVFVQRAEYYANIGKKETSQSIVEDAFSFLKETDIDVEYDFVSKLFADNIRKQYEDFYDQMILETPDLTLTAEGVASIEEAFREQLEQQDGWIKNLQEITEIISGLEKKLGKQINSFLTSPTGFSEEEANEIISQLDEGTRKLLQESIDNALSTLQGAKKANIQTRRKIFDNVVPEGEIGLSPEQYSKALVEMGRIREIFDINVTNRLHKFVAEMSQSGLTDEEINQVITMMESYGVDTFTGMTKVVQGLAVIDQGLADLFSSMYVDEALSSIRAISPQEVEEVLGDYVTAFSELDKILKTKTFSATDQLELISKYKISPDEFIGMFNEIGKITTYGVDLLTEKVTGNAKKAYDNFRAFIESSDLDIEIKKNILDQLDTISLVANFDPLISQVTDQLSKIMGGFQFSDLTLDEDLFENLKKYLQDDAQKFVQTLSGYEFNGPPEDFINVLFNALQSMLGADSETLKLFIAERSKMLAEVQRQQLTAEIERIVPLEPTTKNFVAALDSLRKAAGKAEDVQFAIKNMGFDITDFAKDASGNFFLIEGSLDTIEKIDKKIASVLNDQNLSVREQTNQYASLLKLKRDILEADRQASIAFMEGYGERDQTLTDIGVYLDNVSKANSTLQELAKSGTTSYNDLFNMLESKELGPAIINALNLEGVSTAVEAFAKMLDQGMVATLDGTLKMTDAQVKALGSASKSTIKQVAEEQIKLIDAQIAALEALLALDNIEVSPEIDYFVQESFTRSDGTKFDSFQDLIFHIRDTAPDTPEIVEFFKLLAKIDPTIDSDLYAMAVISLIKEQTPEVQEMMGIQTIEAQFDIDPQFVEGLKEKIAIRVKELISTGTITEEQGAAITIKVKELDVTDLQAASNTLGGIIQEISQVNVDTTKIDSLIESMDKISTPVEGETKPATVATDVQTMGEKSEEATGKVDTLDESLSLLDTNAAGAATRTKTLVNTLTGLSSQAMSTGSAISSLSSKISALQSKTVTITTEYKTKGTPTVEGTVATATSSGGGGGGKGAIIGMASADGGTGMLGKVLVGELGPELVVSDGRYSVVGQKGAEFVNLQKRDIVFSAEQTKKLMSGASGIRGTALAYGNWEGPAMAGGGGINAAISQLKAARDAWSQVLGSIAGTIDKLGSKSGGGGGSSKTPDSDYLMDLEKWFNLLRQIEKLENNITIIRAKRQNITQGRQFAENLLLENQYLEQQKGLLQTLVNEQTKYRDSLKLEYLQKYGRYFYFVGDAIQINADAILQDTKNNEELGEELQNLMDSYDEITQQIVDNTVAIEDNTKAQKDNLRILRDQYISMEEQILKALQYMYEKEISMREKVVSEKIKSDNAYIKALQNNLNREKKMLDKNARAEERSALQRRLQLLERDTSGKNAKEIAQLREQLRQMNEEDYFQQRQDAIDNIQEASKAWEDAQNKEIDILKETNQLKLENMQLYWDEVNRIIEQGADAVLSFVTSFSEEFLKGSLMQQEDFIEEWKMTIESALAWISGEAEAAAQRLAALSTQTQIGNTSATGGLNQPSGGGGGGASSGTGSMGGEYGYTNEQGGYSFIQGGQIMLPKVSQLTETLKRGSRGEAVAMLQQALLGNGIPLPKYGVDGKFEAETEDALKKFQAMMGLKIDGILGSATKSAFATRGYEQGGWLDSTGLFMGHGTKQKPEAVLNADQSKAFLKFAESDFLRNVENLVNSVSENTENNIGEIDNSNNINIQEFTITIPGSISRQEANKIGESAFDGLIKAAQRSGYNIVSRR